MRHRQLHIANVVAAADIGPALLKPLEKLHQQGSVWQRPQRHADDQQAARVAAF